MQCPVCGDGETGFYWRDQAREYVRCGECGLVFVPPRYYLSAAEEKKRYDLHENSPENEGYVRFLKKLFDPVMGRLAPGAAGLDFGSGPGPVLAKMFRTAGFDMTLYDVFYAPDTAALEKSYDFITVCETAEHLHHPGRDLTLLYRLLRPGGMLAVMTKPVVPVEQFETWHYRKDETHVCFFAPETFQWLAERWGAKLEILPDGVVIFSSEK
ncbi:MAG TPA: class I SAM-dependent methyltransferase [Candidatus Aminicenantes bacterium]|nr:class I SAM-dependent methyltransferase [Candidatus Aminicenantes bacterium]